MTDEQDEEEEMKPPEGGKAAKISRGALQVIGGAVPFAGGVLSAIAGAWSEGEQEKVNRFFEHWVRMLQDELKEKQDTIIEIMARLDLQDEAISQRVESKEYQSLLKKTFREWSGAESEDKRIEKSSKNGRTGPDCPSIAMILCGFIGGSYSRGMRIDWQLMTSAVTTRNA